MTSQLVVFPEAYTAPPNVLVSSKGFDAQASQSVAVTAYTTDSTATGFIVHLDGPGLFDDSVSWPAYPSNTPSGVSSDTMR